MKTIEAYRVLFIDDHTDNHEHFRRILAAGEGATGGLEQVGAKIAAAAAPGPFVPRFELDFARQGGEGLACVMRAREGGRPYAIAFVDLGEPPGWDGLATLAQLRQADPAMELVLCGASTNGTWPTLPAPSFLLTKPFDAIVVLQMAAALSDKWRLAVEARSHLSKLEAQLRQSQKVDSIGQLAGGIAHDFNNLLTVINGHASLLQSAEKLTPRGAESVKEIIEAGKRASALTRQLMTYSRKQEFQAQVVDLNEVVHHITKMLRRILGEDVALQVEFSPALPSIMADVGMVEQVLLNLAVNARDAMPRGGQILIKTSAMTIDAADAQKSPEAAPGQYVCMTFSDNGRGIEPENLPRIFEPFFATKQTDRGTGLGLATVYGIVKQHKGWISVESRLGHGTTFQVFLPASAACGGALPMPATGQKVIGGAETLLVVEDEMPLLKLMQHILESHGYKVLACSNARQALEFWRDPSRKIDLLLTDLILPDGMAGTELARILQQAKPDLKILYTSGYSAERLAKEFPPGTPFKLVQKPFHARRLAELVFETLSSRS